MKKELGKRIAMKREYHYYVQHNETVSYVWKGYIDKNGYTDCDDFEVSIKGKGREEEAGRICNILNKGGI